MNWCYHGRMTVCIRADIVLGAHSATASDYSTCSGLSVQEYCSAAAVNHKCTCPAVQVFHACTSTPCGASNAQLLLGLETDMLLGLAVHQLAASIPASYPGAQDVCMEAAQASVHSACGTAATATTAACAAGP